MRRGGTRFVGSYEAGTPYVPETGMALVHQGERITPAGQNAQDLSRVIAALEAIADRLDRQHAEDRRGMRQLIRTVAEGTVAEGMVVDETSLARGLAPELSRQLATRWLVLNGLIRVSAVESGA